MSHLRNSILRLQSIKAMRKKLSLLKIANADDSVLIITEETIKELWKIKERKRYSPAAAVVLKTMKRLKQRFYHYPIQYTLGKWYFRQLHIVVTRPLLIPRFETENLVSLMIQQIRKRWQTGAKLQVVDFCCGTGVIGLSILKELANEYDLNGIFIDLNPKAVEYTKINAVLNGISLEKIKTIEGDMLSYLQLIGQSQIVSANPPYLSEASYRKLQKEVKLYEDRQALISGPEGMDLVKPILEVVLQQTHRNDLLVGIEYNGQSVQRWNLEQKIVRDQYGRRRYVII